MPCWDLFDEQSAEYKESVLPSAVRARVAVEAGIPIGWERYVGLEGRVVGQTQFGASGPAKEVFKHFGFTAEERGGACQRNDRGGEGRAGKK